MNSGNSDLPLACDNLDEKALYVFGNAVWRKDGGESGGSGAATVSV